MRKFVAFFVSALWLSSGMPVSAKEASASSSDSSAEILVNLLLKKGVLNQEEAAEVLGEMETIEKNEQAKLKKIPEKGTIVSGKYGKKHTLTGYTQADAHFGDSVLRTPDNTAEIRRARIGLEGKIIDPLEYKLMLDMVGINNNGVLRDAKLSYKVMDELVLNAGQFKTPFSLEGYTSSSRIDTIERSVFVNAIYPERQVGGSISGSLFDGFFTYEGGAFNGNGFNNRNDDRDFLYIGRVAVTPIKDKKILEQDTKVTIGGSLGTSEDTSVNLSALGFPVFVGDRDLFGLDACVEWGPLAVKGEYLRAELEFDGIPGVAANPIRFTPAVAARPARDSDADGWNIIGTLFVLPKRLQVAAKYEEFDSDFVADFEAITLGANWYFNDYDPKAYNSRLMANWVHATQGGAVEEDQVLLRFQVGY